MWIFWMSLYGFHNHSAFRLSILKDLANYKLAILGSILSCCLATTSPQLVGVFWVCTDSYCCCSWLVDDVLGFVGRLAKQTSHASYQRHQPSLLLPSNFYFSSQCLCIHFMRCRIWHNKVFSLHFCISDSK